MNKRIKRLLITGVGTFSVYFLAKQLKGKINNEENENIEENIEEEEVHGVISEKEQETERYNLDRIKSRMIYAWENSYDIYDLKGLLPRIEYEISLNNNPPTEEDNEVKEIIEEVRKRLNQMEEIGLKTMQELASSNNEKLYNKVVSLVERVENLKY